MTQISVTNARRAERRPRGENLGFPDHKYKKAPQFSPATENMRGQAQELWRRNSAAVPRGGDQESQSSGAGNASFARARSSRHAGCSVLRYERSRKPSNESSREAVD
jgi:hypothetical protein